MKKNNKIRGMVNKSVSLLFKYRFPDKKMFEFLNVVLFELQTVIQLFAYIFGTIQIIRFIEVLKKDVYLRDDFSVGAKSVPARPFL